MKKWRVLLVLVVVALVTAGCYPATAATAQGDPQQLSEFLNRLLTSAGIGLVLSFVLEELPYVSDAFGSLDSKMKRLVVLIACLVVPAAALGVGVWRGYYVLTDDSIFQALAAGFEAFTASQLVHLGLMKTKPFS